MLTFVWGLSSIVMSCCNLDLIFWHQNELSFSRLHIIRWILVHCQNAKQDVMYITKHSTKDSSSDTELCEFDQRVCCETINHDLVFSKETYLITSARKSFKSIQILVKIDRGRKKQLRNIVVSGFFCTNYSKKCIIFVFRGKLSCKILCWK